MYSSSQSRDKSPQSLVLKPSKSATSNALVSSSCDFSARDANAQKLPAEAIDAQQQQYSTTASQNQRNSSQWIGFNSLRDALRKSSNSARGSNHSQSAKDQNSQGERKQQRTSRPSSGMGGGAYGLQNEFSGHLRRAPTGQQKSYNTNTYKHQTSSTQKESLLYPKKKQSLHYSSCSSLAKGSRAGDQAYQSSTSTAGMIIDSNRTSRTIKNPRDLLLLPAVVDSSNELSQSTFLEQNQSTDRGQAQRDELDESKLKCGKVQNNNSRNRLQQEEEEFQQQFHSNPYASNTTYNHNHTETPQSILIPDEYSHRNVSRGREIESILRSQMDKIDAHNQQIPSEVQIQELRLSEIHNIQFEADQLLTASPYGQTQELDLRILRNEDLTLNQILNYQGDEQQRTDGDDLMQQVTYRVENANNINYKDEFPSYLLQSSDDKRSSGDSSQRVSILGMSTNYNNNQFKRLKNHQPSQSRDSLSSTRKSILGVSSNQVEIREICLNIEQEENKFKKATARQSLRVQNNTIQLKEMEKNYQVSTQKPTQNFKSSQSGKRSNRKFKAAAEDKENQNPYQSLNAQQSQAQAAVLMGMQQVEDQLLSLRIHKGEESQMVKLQDSSFISNKEEKSFKRRNQFKSVERQKENHQALSNLSKTQLETVADANQTLDLSLTQSHNKSPAIASSKNFIAEPQILQMEIQYEGKDQLQQSPGPDLEMTMQQSFKRNRPSKSSNAAHQAKSENNPLRRQKHPENAFKQSIGSHIQHKSINLNVCQRSDSNTKGAAMFGGQQLIDISQIEQQSSIEMDMSMQMNPIQDEINQIQSKQRLELIQLKKENLKLQRELEAKDKLHQEQIKTLTQQFDKQTNVKTNEIEEENQIIMDGIRQDYEDRLCQLKTQHQQELSSLKAEFQREQEDKDLKISRKREKIYKLRDQFDSKRKEFNALLIELEAYKVKVEEMTQYQLQSNMISQLHPLHTLRESADEMFLASHQSCDHFKSTREVNSKNHHQVSYFSSRDDQLIMSEQKNLFKHSEQKQQQATPYQSCEEVIVEEQKISQDRQDQKQELQEAIKLANSNLNYQSVNSSHYSSGRLGQSLTANALTNLPNDAMLNYYFSLSQQPTQQQQYVQSLLLAYPAQLQSIQEQDSAMNFSFSEVKTSIDNKSSFFEKINNLAANAPVTGGMNKENQQRVDKDSEEEKEQIVLLKRKPKSQVTSAQMQDDSCFNYSPKMGLAEESLSLHTARDFQDTVRDAFQSKTQQESQSLLHNRNPSHSLYNSALLQLESNEHSCSQNSKILVSHQCDDIEPASENCLDDDDYEETEVQEQHEPTEEEEEESKSNLSHKLEDLNASISMSLATGAQIPATGSSFALNQDMTGQMIRNNIIYQIEKTSSEGSENAPEDSGFLSDDGEGQERIVNESSLYNEEEAEGEEEQQQREDYYHQKYRNEVELDYGRIHSTDAQQIQEDQGENLVESLMLQDRQNMILTGRSESAMEDQDEEIEGISKCKAINSSYINLKRNNLLITYGSK